MRATRGRLEAKFYVLAEIEGKGMAAWWCRLENVLGGGPLDGDPLTPAFGTRPNQNAIPLRTSLFWNLGETRASGTRMGACRLASHEVSLMT